MPKIPQTTIDSWRGRATTWLATNCNPPVTCADVLTGRDAWLVAHRAGLCREAYADPAVHDAHIQTALEQVFPSAVFRDKKRY